MGRKTWDSIPPKFRPLKGRLNIVISRSFGPPAQDPVAAVPDPASEPVRAGGLDQALDYLRARTAEPPLGRVFVIGGAQIYAAALALSEARRVLLTKVLSDFECDTDFPVVLDEDAAEPTPGWARCSNKELDEWAGEVVPEGVQEENAISYEFQLWRREDTPPS